MQTQVQNSTSTCTWYWCTSLNQSPLIRDTYPPNILVFLCYGFFSGTWGSIVVKGTTLQVSRTGDRFQASPLWIYSVAADISLCPGVDSASKNEYQDIPGGKGSRCVRVTTLPPSCAECLVIWRLNRPEPSGPHRPVIGVAFFCMVSSVPHVLLTGWRSEEWTFSLAFEPWFV